MNFIRLQSAMLQLSEQPDIITVYNHKELILAIGI